MTVRNHPPPRQASTAMASSPFENNKDLGFVPQGVMSKFLLSIGGPIASGSLQAGYQAGVVTDKELSDVNANLDFETELQSEEFIQQKWKEALADQPWPVKSLGSMASSIVVGLVSNLQRKLLDQATQMKWINDNALPIVQANQTVVDILGGGPIAFNNTRAKYESDKDVWSASMDVLGEQSNKVGLVNAYFTPSEEIRILVVEIDDYMHNLTWKGLK